MRAGQWLDRTLLPSMLEPGTTPWMSLAYLLFPWVPLLLEDFPWTDYRLTALASAAFLPLYFGFYWVRGWRRWIALLAMAGLGGALLPANLFANCFTIYACVLSAFLPLRQMIAVNLIAMTLYGVACWFMGVPMMLFLVMGCLTGVLSATFSRVWIAKARANQAIRLSQDEIRRLAQLAERERIGRDLHDLLGHTLSVVAIKSELAAKLFSRDPAAAQREIADVERVAREALGQVRRAVTGMRAIGLRAEFANARLALAAVEVDFSYRAADLSLHPEIETVLALSLREATTNVIRHSQARNCNADLSRAGEDVRLAIRDDGLGGANESGNGLKGMRERVEAMGGRFEMRSDRGTGTELVLHVPWRAVPEPEVTADTRPRKLAAVR
jgi:two-component system sensor histidine kinase DesK